MISATSRSSVGIWGHLLTGTDGPELRTIGGASREAALTDATPLLRLRGSGTARVRNAPSPPLIRFPSASDGKVGKLSLEAFHHHPPMTCTALLAHDQLAMWGSRRAKDVDAPRQQRRIVAEHDEDPGEYRAHNPPPLAGTVDPHEPTDARDRRQPCHMSTRSRPGRWSEDNRRSPDRRCCGAPGSRAGPIDPAQGSSGHRASPPSPVDRQSSSPGRGRRDGDTADPRWCRPPCRNRRAPLSGPRRCAHARLVAQDVDVCPARVVQTPRSNVTVSWRFRSALRKLYRTGDGSLRRHLAAPVQAVSRAW